MEPDQDALRSEVAPPALRDPKFAYDYFKSMSSVSVATLGGILTLGEAVFGSRISPLQMGIAALPVAASGMLALQGQTDIMQVWQGLKPPANTSRLAIRLVPSLYGLGVGIFLAFLLMSYVAPGHATAARIKDDGQALRVSGPDQPSQPTAAIPPKR